MKCGFTGHRPDKLWGYDLNTPPYVKLKEYLINMFISEKVTEVYTGMALGFDTIVALAAIECKEMGHNIKLIACIPCSQQNNRWSYADCMRYADILRKCDEIIGLTMDGKEVALTFSKFGIDSYVLLDSDGRVYNTPYVSRLLQLRNRVIVNHCDTLIALWDGSKGGTSNCIDYAKSLGYININVKHPNDFIE